MPLFDAFRGNKFKSELEQVTAERDLLKAALSDTERMQYAELKQAIANLAATRAQLEHELESFKVKYQKEQEGLEQQVQNFRARLQAENNELEQRVKDKKKELIEMD